MLGSLIQEVIDGILGLRIDLLVLEKEASPIEVKSDGRTHVVVFLVPVFENVAIGLVDPVVQAGERLDCELEELLEIAGLKEGEVIPELEIAERKVERLLRERDTMVPVNLLADQEMI